MSRTVSREIKKAKQDLADKKAVKNAINKLHAGEYKIVREELVDEDEVAEVEAEEATNEN